MKKTLSSLLIFSLIAPSFTGLVGAEEHNDSGRPEIGDNLIEDGTFETTTQFGDPDDRSLWYTYNQGVHEAHAGMADFDIVDGEVKATIEQVGWEWWHIQLMQDVTVTEGMYKVEFDMRSEEDRPVYVEVTDSGSGIEQFEVTSDMETHRGYFDVDADGDYTFMFGLGRNGDDPEPDTPYDIYLDNVRLVEVDSEPNWELTFEDVFEADELDTDTWRIDIGNGFYNDGEWVPGWGNNELQSYQEDNVFLEDSKLILEAREEHIVDDFGEGGEFDYTSGKVLTDDSFSQAYGRFEASMKLPEGQGYWPAFWMMPQDDVYGGWAASGEIDIMENRGSETDKVGAAIHYGDLWPDNTYSEESYQFPEGQSTTEFNEYAIEWEPGEIRWYVNDELYSTKTEWSTAYGKFPAPFDQEFHMILNLAVGGLYGGEPDETTEFPGRVEVDYVRVYEDTNADHPPLGEYIEPEEDDDTPAVDQSRIFVETSENLIEDGTFDVTTEFGDEKDSIVWNVFNMADHDSSGGKADFEIVDGELKATINQVGWAWWNIQVMQDVDVKEGYYKIEFDMRSDKDRPVSVELRESDSDVHTFDVTDEMRTYKKYIKVNEVGDNDLMFGLGRGVDDPELETPYDMYLDNVRLVEVEEYSKDFIDVPESHWAHEAIQMLASRQLVKGYTNDEFRPERMITRAEFTAMIVRALSLESDTKSSFTDVKTDSWYAPYIDAAYESNIVRGHTETSFRPEEHITREQMAAMVVRAVDFSEQSITGPEEVTPFTDADTVSEWAVDYVEEAQQLGLVQGRASGQFAPHAHSTRAENSQIIFNMLTAK